MPTSIPIPHNTGTTFLELVQGDITGQTVDAIVNAANSGLRGGGGVDGAIHLAGGPQILQECRVIGRCPTGNAVVTSGGNLAAKYVIHAVGPVYRGGQSGESTLLANAYYNSLLRAAEKEVSSLAFPSISAGVYSYPLDEASNIALCTIFAFIQSESHQLELVRFVLFDKSTFDYYSKALEVIE
jgi:O-acetyl-ADP-ribose deacetylase (regulator of RNase III)